MASLDDIATIQKNGVVAINSLNQLLQRICGSTTTASTSSSIVVVTGAGRLINVSVTGAGTTPGAIHNATAVAAVTTANQLAAVGNTIGVAPMNLMFTAGLVIVPGAGQTLNVTYSLGS